MELESNDGGLHVEDIRVDGNLQVFRNRGGPFTIHDNEIKGSLECKDKSPPPTASANDVKGNKDGQCSGL